MKKRVTKFVLVVFILSLSHYAYSQISPKIYGKPADLKAMAKRTLVVELLEEDPKVIEKLSKKKKRPEKLQKYKDFIALYNEMIQDAVSKYWTFNENIEYLSAMEVKDIIKAKDKKYVILSYFELGDIDDEWIDRSDLKVPALRYQRAERTLRMPDYKIYLPSSFVRDGQDYLESDFKFAIICMQANIRWIIENNKILHFSKYAEKIAEENCSKLKSMTLLVDSEYLFKTTTESKVRSVYKSDLEFVHAEQLDKTFVSGEMNKAVLFTIPYALLKGSSPGRDSATLVYFKVIVDSETGEILWVHNLSKMGYGENFQSTLIKAEFKRMVECRM